MLYYIETFGCQMNVHDSETMAGLLEQAGHTEADCLEQAQIVVFNTCAVRQSSENRIIGHIGNLKHHKEAKPDSIIIIAGCMTQQKEMPEKLLQKFPFIDIALGTYAMDKLPQYIEEVMHKREKFVDNRENLRVYEGTLPSKRIDKSRAYVTIMYGCNNFCSYCIVPYVRGRERSRAPQEIKKEILALAADGCKEIMLLGQNVNSYGKDLSKQINFAGLLREIHDIEGIERIRYMTSHPRDFNLELLNTIAELPKICRSFHLPVQSGCDKILQKMNRGYTTATYKQLIKTVRNMFPVGSITTDLIVGFPGETEEDFRQTLEFLQECAFDAAYTFVYSKRSGTPAAEDPNQISAEVKKARILALMEVQNPISLNYNKAMIGREELVLVEGPSHTKANILTGRTDTNKIVNFPGDEKLIGEFIPVTIIAAKTWHLTGKIVKTNDL